MKKGKKLIVFAGVCIALGIVCGIVGIMAGALNEDNWVKANENRRVRAGMHRTPIEKTLVLDEADLAAIKKLKVEGSGDDISITVGTDETEDIQVRYYEDYANQKVVYVSQSTLVLDRENKKWWANSFGGFDWLINRNYDIIEVILPPSFAFTHCDIDISGGSLLVDGVDLGKVTELEVSGGKVAIKNCSMSVIEELDNSGSSVSMENCTIGGGVEMEISGGGISLKNCTIGGKFTLDNSGGSVKFKGGSIGNASCSLSGGSLTLEDLTSTGNLNFQNISGGRVYLTRLPFAASEVSVRVSSSGGRVTFNGSRLNGSREVTSPSCLITAKLSGGRLNVSTK